jgi:serine phosphatase RsbU (regulator of sigma subunit)
MAAVATPCLEDAPAQQPESVPTTDDRPKVLIVDDNPRNLLALEVTLSDLPLNLVEASSGPQALRHLLDEDFALILMDVRMPEMDGFETAELIRQRERSQHTPIIFLTAYANDDVQVFKGYSLGAVDYLPKPIVPQVLRSKVSVFVDMFRKTEEIKQQAELLRELEQRQHQRELAEVKERMESQRLRDELRIARQIQQKLFPVAPLPLPGFDVGGASLPAEATGGDYFDYVPIRDGGLGILIGDVSGHGFGPALLMAQTRTYLRAFLLSHTDVREIIALVDTAVVDDSPDGRFMTLLFARLDPAAKSFQYVSAGHTTGYLLDRSGNVKTQIESTGMPLGVVPVWEFEAAPTLHLEPGDLLLLLTDGVVEAHDSDEQLFGPHRMLDVVRNHRDRPAREIVNTLFDSVRDFCWARAQFDDMTAVVVKVADEA